MNPILLIAALAAGAYFIAGKQFAAKASFKLQQVKFNKPHSLSYGFTQLFFNVTGTISNPTKFNLHVNNIQADIIFKGKKIATISHSAGFDIQPEKTVKITTYVQLDTLAAFATLAEAAQALDKAIEFTIKGSVNLNAGVLSINEVIKVTA